jgi:hypothetical protein
MSAFGTNDSPLPSLEEQQWMEEMEARELQHIKLLQDIRNINLKNIRAKLFTS